ncbi:hypothetical protein BaRGS_00039977, partial [Batillaria attramentaria]
VIDLASLSDNKSFYFYTPASQGAEPSTPEPHQLQLTVEDQLMTATEVYSSHSFTKPKI